MRVIIKQGELIKTIEVSPEEIKDLQTIAQKSTDKQFQKIVTVFLEEVFDVGK
jgi:hypothetical protein